MKSVTLVIAVFAVVAIFGSNVAQAYPNCPDCGICQDLYKPVCGADGVTYGNACQLGCEKTCAKPGLKVVHDGECGNPVKYAPH